MSTQLRLAVDRPNVSLAEPLLTASDAAALLAVRRSWIYDAVRQGHLPCVRVGKHVRFLRSDLEHWVAESASLLGIVTVGTSRQCGLQLPIAAQAHSSASKVTDQAAGPPYRSTSRSGRRS